MKLCMYSMDKRAVEDIEVDELIFPGPKGETAILSGHTDLISQVTVGEIRFIDSLKKNVHHYAVSHGFLRVNDDDIMICAYTLEQPKDIDVERAIKAQKEAEEKLKDAITDIEEFNKYELKLHRALIRQQVAKKASSTTP